MTNFTLHSVSVVVVGDTHILLTYLLKEVCKNTVIPPYLVLYQEPYATTKYSVYYCIYTRWNLYNMWWKNGVIQTENMIVATTKIYHAFSLGQRLEFGLAMEPEGRIIWLATREIVYI